MTTLDKWAGGPEQSVVDIQDSNPSTSNPVSCASRAEDRYAQKSTGAGRVAASVLPVRKNDLYRSNSPHMTRSTERDCPDLIAYP